MAAKSAQNNSQHDGACRNPEDIGNRERDSVWRVTGRRCAAVANRPAYDSRLRRLIVSPAVPRDTSSGKGGQRAGRASSIRDARGIFSFSCELHRNGEETTESASSPRAHRDVEGSLYANAIELLEAAGYAHIPSRGEKTAEPLRRETGVSQLSWQAGYRTPSDRQSDGMFLPEINRIKVNAVRLETAAAVARVRARCYPYVTQRAGRGERVD